MYDVYTYISVSIDVYACVRVWRMRESRGTKHPVRVSMWNPRVYRLTI